MPNAAPHPPKLTVNEIFLSIQGESTWAGLPCVFVRLTGCDLRCSYCDTAYAFTEGTRRPLDEVLAEALAFDCPLVEVTGGEPLLQPASLQLMAALCDAGRTVLLCLARSSPRRWSNGFWRTSSTCVSSSSCTNSSGTRNSAAFRARPSTARCSVWPKSRAAPQDRNQGGLCRRRPAWA